MMDTVSAVMVVLPEGSDQAFAAQVAHALGYAEADLVFGSPADAIRALAERSKSPQYIVIDIGERGHEVLADLDMMAGYCEANTQVVIIGAINDVHFYRELKQRGVTEYFTRPAQVADVRAAFLSSGAARNAEGSGQVISFMSAASGDGSSTIALNTAFALAQRFRQPTVLVDMDFQFGMVAKSLDLSAQFGIKELFEHPERGIDATLIAKMTAEYAKSLKVIATPNELRFLPGVKPEVIRDLIATLRAQYAYVVIDLPHVWTPWIAAALSNSTQVVMVAQLWLRSLNHAARLLGAWKDIGVARESITLTINRSGAKFKEALTARDFERIAAHPIAHSFANDIKTIVEAENVGKTITEIGASELADNIHAFAARFLPEAARAEFSGAAGASKPSLFKLFKG